MIIFYHDDADGRCAAFWALKQNPLADVVAMDYGKHFPLETVMPHEEIWILDYSIEPEEMLSLLNISSHVIWIDHHKTAIEKYKDFSIAVAGVRKDGVSGCMLTYAHLHHNDDIVEAAKEAPFFTCFIDDWDTWKHVFPETKSFMVALMAEDYAPKSPIWNSMLNHHTERIMIEEGYTMLAYRDGWAKDYMRYGFETSVNGYKTFAINLGHCNSEFFKSIESPAFDILCAFVFDGQQKKWRASLYSNTVDVSEIAALYGGGGHAGASGFTAEKLPDWLTP